MKLFELFVLEGFQAGLTWELVLKRREALKKAFEGFEPEKIAAYTEKDAERLMNSPGMIKNRAKISAVINNARQLLSIQKEFASFNAYIWSFVNGKPMNHAFKNWKEMPAETEESRTMSRDLKKRGFKFAGPVIIYSFMQAAGLVNDHLVSCFRHDQVQRSQDK